ncbi:MAG: FtsW/RodA/SpoVE family cell cycle protein [Clostridiales bacterium]|nr:FtsW/RodA/SpoVE family cell cycle protein [Clostridiales bacterium]MDY2872280.1 FtsW/RodA/SpoVE family cell cycle protein [Eubacteriales bacterium]
MKLFGKRKEQTESGRFAALWNDIKRSRYRKGLIRHFEWPLVIMVLVMSIWGIVSIFAATGSPVEEGVQMSFLEKITTQSLYYPRLQFFWVCAGMVALAAVSYFDYRLYGRWKNLFYWGNVIVLALVKFTTEVGRGAANMFFQWGSGRTFQPAEFGKIAIIIALAQVFSSREKPIKTLSELIRMSCYVGLPLILIVIQPDVGTALVYVAIYAILIWASGTNYKLVVGTICIGVILVVAAWYVLNFSDNFRVDRIQVWLNPDYDINNSGMQTYNARLMLGSGGLWGKGLFSVGNFAALNYVPDDHTDFIFAVVCETFGFVGGGLMILLYLAMLLRMMYLANHAEDTFGCYLIIGVMAMMFFHIFENISMVIGLMPVTGIPLPFVSYGGSNYITNIMGIGLVCNVAMRSRAGVARQARPTINPAKLVR